VGSRGWFRGAVWVGVLCGAWVVWVSLLSRVPLLGGGVVGWGLGGVWLGVGSVGRGVPIGIGIVVRMWCSGLRLCRIVGVILFCYCVRGVVLLGGLGVFFLLVSECLSVLFLGLARSEVWGRACLCILLCSLFGSWLSRRVRYLVAGVGWVVMVFFRWTVGVGVLVGPAGGRVVGWWAAVGVAGWPGFGA